MEQSPNNQQKVNRIFAALKKDYTLIGTHHVKAWNAWLIVGVFAGAIGATVFIANRSGEVEKGQASDLGNIALPSNVVLDVPSYFHDSLRRPRRIFSGRKLLIKHVAPFRTSNVSLSGGGSVTTLTAKRIKESDRTLSVEIPENIPTGSYQVSYTIDGASQTFPVVIYSLTSQEVQSVRVPSAPSDPSVIYRTKICDNCYWEMVFAGDPKDSQKLVHNSGNLLTRSITAGRSWISEYLDTITDYPRPNIQNAGDPKIATAKNYEGFYFSTLFVDISSTTRAVLGGLLSKGMYSGRMSASFFRDIPVQAPSTEFLFADYPKLAVDPQSSNIYISANAWFEDTRGQQVGLFSSRDGGNTFIQQRIGNGFGSNITSMAINDGILYAVRPGVGSNDEIFRFRSVDPMNFDTYRLPGGNRIWPPKVSTHSNRAWHIYGGPEVVVDNSVTSPHRGRLYVIWAQEERAISDSEFEYPFYGFNFDVFASHSDNHGETWSAPVRVNDDVGTGDQFFPSARVDDSGRLHIAFIDHRDNQDQAVFDVYYTHSRDGASFSKNIRVTDMPTSNNPSGGRSIGDYLDMVMGYPDRAYVAYPCGQNDFGPTGVCMVQIALPPVPNITANSSDGPVTISPSGALSIAVSLDPGSSSGKPADWWAAAQTPFGLYWYTTDRGWVRSDTPVRGYAGPLINIPPTVILSVNAPAPLSISPVLKTHPLPEAKTQLGIPMGTYTFHFGIDTNQNGVLDEPSFRDAVVVNVGQ